MKKSYLLLTVPLVLSTSLWAAPVSVECTTDTLFEENKCSVCYTDTIAHNPTKTEVTSVEIPWEYKSKGDLSEIIYSNEQTFPTIKSTLTVKTTPEKPEELWENSDTLKWEPFADYKESVIKKDQKVGLYRLKKDAKITIEKANTDDEVLFVAPLTYHEFNADISEESGKKERIICVLSTLTATKPTTTVTPTAATPTSPLTLPDTTTTTTTTPVTTPEKVIETVVDVPQDTIETDVPALNAAAPEPELKEQTAVETGPGMWIALLMALVFASSWNAWKKSQNV